MMSRTDINDTECERFINEYLELDKYERVPLSLTFHLLTCKKCRTQVRLLTITEIMQKINPAWDPETCSTNPVSMTKWIIGGIAMILFMLVFAIFTSSASDQRLLVAFYLVFGGVVTSYCTLFVGSNMDFFVKKIHTMKNAM